MALAALSKLPVHGRAICCYVAAKLGDASPTPVCSLAARRATYDPYRLSLYGANEKTWTQVMMHGAKYWLIVININYKDIVFNRLYKMCDKILMD